MTGNFKWDIIINIANNVFIIWPISLPLSSTVRVISVLLK